MRFTDRIKFYKNGKYNPKTSTYDDPELVGEAVANVTHVGTTRSMQLFGNINSDKQTVRLIESFDKDWSYLTINDNKTHYVKVTAIIPLKINGYIVGESHE
ncbi:hypothetical protein [Pediococcus pentosaceus]|uniref:hypothetical protein n=1 Tax=Pediococcus pentosaceus TaxID=1255 RepID=UPI001330C698|nr:hypothetical protein [Pediococcus pentosaceus]KAF0422772.1 hypothetical protein GBO84_05495 [Pediococcus pentosaceus]